MKNFLDDIKNELNQDCRFCEKIEIEIEKFKFFLMPREMFLITDYVYYPKNDDFEKASRMTTIFGNQKSIKTRLSLKKFCIGLLNDIGENYFEKFILLHVVLGTSDLMPVIMIVFEDDTYKFDVFHSDIKTTFYRKINETAKMILDYDVREVYFMQTYITIPAYNNVLMHPSNDRMKFAQDEFLVFMRVDNELNEQEVLFDAKHIKDINYIINQLEISSTKLNTGKINMTPIVKAFVNKKG